VHPQPESYWGYINPIGSRSCYDQGKRCAETLFFDYRRQGIAALEAARRTRAAIWFRQQRVTSPVVV
jgi:UDP-glucuronate decarboxylase